MPELFRRSADRRLAHQLLVQHDASTTVAMSAVAARSELDEFALGFRDCANASVRYLEAATTVTPSETGEEPCSTGRKLVDALRLHLAEHEQVTSGRRRRRRRHDDVDEPPGCSAASSEQAIDGQSSAQPPRRRRRLHRTPSSTQPRPSHLPQSLHRPEEMHQTVRSQDRQDGRFSGSSCVVSGTFNSSRDDSGYDGDSDTSLLVSVDGDVADGEESDRENVNDLLHCASQLSALASRDVRIARVLTELFELMDSDDEVGVH